jgi:hypothetical protein
MASMQTMPIAMKVHSTRRAATYATAPASCTRLWIEYGTTAVPTFEMISASSSTAPIPMSVWASDPAPVT